MPRLLTSLNLDKHELRYGVVQNLAADPLNADSRPGQLYYNTATNRLKYFAGTSWIDPTSSIALILSGDLSGTASNGDLNATINDSAVTTQKLADDAVTTAKLADQSVTSAILAPGSVNTLALGDGQVTNDKLAGSVSNDKLLTLNTAGLVANAATTATALSLANTIALRDGNREFAVNQITLGTDPTQAMHAATKQYVDGLAAGLDVKASAYVATYAPLPPYSIVSDVLVGVSDGPLSVDGVMLNTLGTRVLVKDESGFGAPYNGLYTITVLGEVGVEPWQLTRAEDADNSTANEVTTGMFCFVTDGIENAGTGWVLTTQGTITLGTTDMLFTQFSEAGVVQAGTGLQKLGTVLSLANSGVTAGDYFKVTVDAMGRVTGGTNPTTLAAFGITDATRRAEMLFGNDLNTAFDLAHGLGQMHPTVTIWDSNDRVVICDTQALDQNTIRVYGFDTPPTLNELRLVAVA